MMTYVQALQYLDSFINFEQKMGALHSSDFKLERVVRLLEFLGHPQKKYKIIHVAGSKGKGSVCAMTASILKSAGFKVGLYTSPHLQDVRERIRILEKTNSGGSLNDVFVDMISPSELCSIIEEARPAIEKIRNQASLGRLTFFESYTALALYYFSREAVDYAILETGLGGRLDATNAVEADIAVITSISLEHTHILGTTCAQIAQEKAGIIKRRGQRVVVASQDVEVRDILQAHCLQIGTNPLWVESYVKVGKITAGTSGQELCLSTPKSQYHDLNLPLLGGHQVGNAATAVAIAECLKDESVNISEADIREGLASVFWPGRMEVVGADPVIILDGAHNPNSVRMLVRSVRSIFVCRKVVVVLGVCADKDVGGIESEIESLTQEIIYAKADHPRAYPFLNALPVSEAVDLARMRAGMEDVVLITGSIYVISEARQYLQSRNFKGVSG